MRLAYLVVKEEYEKKGLSSSPNIKRASEN